MNRTDAATLLSEVQGIVNFKSVEKSLGIPNGTINEAIQTVIGNDGSDNLATLLEVQKTFMKLLDIPDPESIGDEYIKNSYFNDAVVSLVLESAEVVDALRTVTKPWKHKTDDEVRAHVMEETTDVLFMLLEVFALASISAEEIMHFYALKLQKNLDRLASSGSDNAAQAIAWRLQLSGDVADESTIRSMMHAGTFTNFIVTQRQRLGGNRRVMIEGTYVDNKWQVIAIDGYNKGKTYIMGEDELVRAIQEEVVNG